MDSNKQLSREAEDANADAAFGEWRATGKTDRRCLRCGGEFIFHDGGSGYMVKCQRCDYRLTARGI